MPKLAKQRECTGCMLCGDVCPKKAINFVSNEGFYVPEIDANLCIECKICERYCPELHAIKEHPSVNLLKPVAGWAMDVEVRKKSASGGAFYAIAHHFIRENEKINRQWRIVGAVIEKESVELRMISSAIDLDKLQGTKYLAPFSKNIYIETLKALQGGISVLFSGLPCQINALYRLLEKKKYSGHLLTCDLICNGIPSNELLKYTLPDAKQILSFRDKEDGWGHRTAIKYVTNDNKIHRETLDNNYFLKSLCSNFWMRDSCYNCKYCTINRESDFTLGDWWGCNLAGELAKDGVSLVIPHNEDAKYFLDNAPFFQIGINWIDCLPHNPRIFTGKRIIGRAIPRFIRSNISHLSSKLRYLFLTGEANGKIQGLVPFVYLRWINYLRRLESKIRTMKFNQIISELDNETK